MGKFFFDRAQMVTYIFLAVGLDLAARSASSSRLPIPAPDGKLRMKAILPRIIVAYVLGMFCTLVAPSPTVGTVFSQEQDSAQDLLSAGLRLEGERKWSDAIRHYESALRNHPGAMDLQQRLQISRLHHDVHRRYEDVSYLQAVREVSTQQALDLYAEILANLETHYVDSIQWQRVLTNGTASLEVALTEPAFVNRLLGDVDKDQIETFRLKIHQHALQRPATGRHDLRATAAYVAGLANKELGLAGSATALEFACGAISNLDTYSRFLTPNQMDETFSNIEGNFVGLGVELKAEEDCLRILNVIRGGPADQAGICSGDAIVRVEDSRTASVNPDYAADLLRGPENSYVSITIVDANGKPRDLEVQRRRVDVPSIEDLQIVDRDNGIGYLRLTNFQKNTTRDFEAALWDLHRQGMRQLIVDVRGNPGGLLTSAVEIADRFISSGDIVLTRGRSSRENFDYRSHRPNTWSIPLTVLIDGDSASASEIFAGAIADHNRGQLIGTRTYGKGSVQGVFRMQSARVGLCLTTAKFYSPSRQPISDRGVLPTITVEQPGSYVAARVGNDPSTAIAKDPVLRKAIEVAVDSQSTVAGRQQWSK